jgi:hypothetical protein
MTLMMDDDANDNAATQMMGSNADNNDAAADVGAATKTAR